MVLIFAEEETFNTSFSPILDIHSQSDITTISLMIMVVAIMNKAKESLL